jgi:hypothetical protein
MVKPTLLRTAGAIAMAAAAFGSVSCGEVVRASRSPVLVLIDAIEVASGAEPDRLVSILFSDVETLVAAQINGQSVRVPTIFADPGRVTFRAVAKNPGTPVTTTGPTPLNDVTMTRYHVEFRRADGRNTPGVDIPYAFDGAFTITVGGGNAGTVGFEVVRHQMKQDPPLRNLRGSGGANIISTIAEITFYGRDAVGNEVSAQGFVTVNFGDFGDPQ